MKLGHWRWEDDPELSSEPDVISTVLQVKTGGSRVRLGEGSVLTQAGRHRVAGARLGMKGLAQPLGVERAGSSSPLESLLFQTCDLWKCQLKHLLF